MKQFALIAALLAACLPLNAQLARTAPPEIDEALREKVSGFYTHFQRGEFREAENFVAEESKDLFYGAKKNRILNFEIRNVEFEEDFRAANVIVLCETIVPMMGSKPFAVPLASEWKFDGDLGWMMHLKDPGEARERVAMAGSPFGNMQFRQDLPEPGKLRDQTDKAQVPTIESLSGMYHASTENMRFIGANSPSSQSFTIHNRSAGKMTIEQVAGHMEPLEVQFESTEIEAGQSTKITITYNPQVKKLMGRHRVDFQLMPISQTVSLYIDF